MTVMGTIIVILGAGSVAVNLMLLIDKLDTPAPRRPRHAI